MTQSIYQGFPPPSAPAPSRANYGGYAAPPIDPQRGGPMSLGANCSSRIAQPVQPEYGSQKRCVRCGEPGHYARDCPTNRAPGWEEKRKLAARKPSSKGKDSSTKSGGSSAKSGEIASKTSESSSKSGQSRAKGSASDTARFSIFPKPASQATHPATAPEDDWDMEATPKEKPIDPEPLAKVVFGASLAVTAAPQVEPEEHLPTMQEAGEAAARMEEARAQEHQETGIPARVSSPNVRGSTLTLSPASPNGSTPVPAQGEGSPRAASSIASSAQVENPVIVGPERHGKSGHLDFCPTMDTLIELVRTLPFPSAFAFPSIIVGPPTL